MEVVAILVMGLGAIGICFTAWQSACMACEDDMSRGDRIALTLWSVIQAGACVLCIAQAAKAAASA